MSHKHASLLRSIFHDPISANIHWREVESLLNHLGATVEPAHGARFRVRLNRAEAFLHHPHHSNVCDRSLIKQLREFLLHAGVSVSSYEAGHGGG
ncbi:MAG: type II toxin-antitoxin system HicA family toxin [Hyphomicrobiales bacterium]|nr:type II toxin-antitoxin system HicA family toxin [Hyphomicrobiales bacterium]